MKKIFAVSLAVFGTIFLTGCSQQQTIQAQPQATQPIPREKEQVIPPKTQPAVPAPQAAIVVPTGWSIYTNSAYGFELKTPEKLEALSVDGSTGDITGKNYTTVQVASGSPSIKVIKNISDLSKDPYGDSPYTAEPQVTLNGIQWYVFYNPKGGMPGCDMATFQTFLPNGKDALYVSTLDENHCPGNPKEAPSVVFLKQALSTFKFIR